MYKQINVSIKKKLSKCTTGFKKLHETQHSMVTMLEKWRKVIDKTEYIHLSAPYLFMKAFDTINHHILLAKLHAYGFSKNALNLISSYLTNRKQGVQNNSNFSTAKTIISGILQRSIDGHLLSKLFINDLALYLTETMLSNYDDDNNLLNIGKDINEVKDTLAKDFRIVTNWFYENFMILNIATGNNIVWKYGP